MSYYGPSRFLPPHNRLDVELLDESGGQPRWRLHRPLALYSQSMNQVVTVPPDTVTDFASVPRLPFMYWFLGNTATRPGVVHDYLYKQGALNGAPITRAQADQVFLDASDADGQPWLRSRTMWTGLRVGGMSTWRAYRARDGR